MEIKMQLRGDWLSYFIYTQNKEVIKQLESLHCKRITIMRDGTAVYTSPATSTLKFENQENTWCSDTLVF